ncbi:MAG: kelch repeat-containing protein, partial [Flavobacteriaceae bacterium]|nr:kelch repeat-containing protein [Flavobacteriaceae bacterium]
MAEIKPGAAGVITNITQIPTRNHNDTQNRDAADAHPASSITGLTVINNLTDIPTRNHNDLQNLNAEGHTVDAFPSTEFNVANKIAKLDAGAKVPLAQLGGITNTEIAAAAAIAYSKLSLANSILTSDILSTEFNVANKIAKLDASALLPLAHIPIIPAQKVSRDYGYTAGGWTPLPVATTEKYDDIADTWTAKANLNTGRLGLAGFSLNGYGYTAGGSDAIAESAVVEKYDDVANTWTAKTSMNTARPYLAGFALGALHAGVQNPEII